MKRLLLFAFLTSTLGTFSQSTRTTVSNGNATNPLIWDCTCLPQPGEHLVINHNVVLDVNWVYFSGSLTINQGASLTQDLTTRNVSVWGTGVLNNKGTLTIRNLLLASSSTLSNTGTIGVTANLLVTTGSTFSNSSLINISDTLGIQGTINNNAGTINVATFLNTGTYNNNTNGNLYVSSIIYTNGTFNNNGWVTVNLHFLNSEDATNNMIMDIKQDFYNGDSLMNTAEFINNGLVSVGNNWYNSEDVTGTGQFCIANYTANSGNITGTLDFCDKTGGNIDANSGTIAGTVTYCNTNCNVGEIELEKQTEVQIYPNPFEKQLNILINESGNFSARIFDITGQELFYTPIQNGTNTLTVELSTGIYFCKIYKNGQVYIVSKLVK
ncbi:MAG: T9SS type A sorting domain-containing protein [Flavobacteriales bacterium]|nr:T9SS type A sorting domain-containing protein [Flavobacteriales bacterium]